MNAVQRAEERFAHMTLPELDAMLTELTTADPRTLAPTAADKEFFGDLCNEIGRRRDAEATARKAGR